MGDICPPLPLPLEDVDVQPKIEPHPGVNFHDTGTKTLECEEGHIEKDQVEEWQAEKDRVEERQAQEDQVEERQPKE